MVSKSVEDFFNKLSKKPDIDLWSTDQLIDYAKELDITDKSLTNFLNDTNYAEKSLANYKQYIESTSKQTTSFSSTLSQLGGTLLSTLGNMAIMYAASAAIEFIGTKIYEYIYATELAIEAGEKAQNNIKEVYDTYNNKVSTVTDLGRQFASDAASINTTSDAVESLTQKYAELKKGVNADNSNKSLSSKEYQQYLNISNQLAETFPSLVAGSDSAGNAILNLGSNASDAADKLERLLETQMAIAHTEITKDSKDSFKGAYAEAESYDKEIENLKRQRSELERQIKK